jgi:hypothetical protein
MLKCYVNHFFIFHVSDFNRSYWRRIPVYIVCVDVCVCVRACVCMQNTSTCYKWQNAAGFVDTDWIVGRVREGCEWKYVYNTIHLHNCSL